MYTTFAGLPILQMFQISVLGTPGRDLSAAGFVGHRLTDLMQHTVEDSRTSSMASTAAGHASLPRRDLNGVRGSRTLESRSSLSRATCISETCCEALARETHHFAVLQSATAQIDPLHRGSATAYLIARQREVAGYVHTLHQQSSSMIRPGPYGHSCKPQSTSCSACTPAHSARSPKVDT